MGYLLILIWIKVYYNFFHWFGIFKLKQFLQHLTKKGFEKNGKVNNLKSLMWFELITQRFVVNALTNCSLLLGKTFWKYDYYKFILNLINYFDMKYFTNGSVTYYLRIMQENKFKTQMTKIIVKFFFENCKIANNPNKNITFQYY